MVEHVNQCMMCGDQWIDEDMYFWCIDCVEWMADRRRFIQDNAA